MHELDPEVEDRNYAKQPLTKAELERIVSAAGSVAAVLNTRHKVAKEQGWKEKPPSKTAFVKAALEENNLLRRPIVIADGRAVVGRNEDEIRALFG